MLFTALTLLTRQLGAPDLRGGIDSHKMLDWQVALKTLDAEAGGFGAKLVPETAGAVEREDGESLA